MEAGIGLDMMTIVVRMITITTIGDDHDLNNHHDHKRGS